MTSCAGLERPGRWRAWATVALLLLTALPSFPLVWQSATRSVSMSLGGGFASAVGNSLAVAVLVAGSILVVGVTAGVAVGLYEFPGRRCFLALVVLPALVPTFLWAIGWSALTAGLGPAATALLSGHAGCVLVFSAGTLPLTVLTAYTSTTTLSGSQVEAARLAGGEHVVLLHACRHALTPTALVAGLGGVLTLSDPGPGQILSLRTAASEILVSFSALYDFALAGRQCVVLAALVLVGALPIAALAATRLSAEILGRQTRPMPRRRSRQASLFAVAGFTLIVLITVGAPLTGLVLPLLGGVEFSRAANEVARTGVNTLLYAIGAGTVASVMGFLLAAFVGRSQRLRVTTLGACLVLFALPPALLALGIVSLATDAPAWTDPLLRGRATVCLTLGLRFFPVAAVLGLRAWGSMSPSWAQAAAVHGVPIRTYVRRVVVPFLLPAAAAAGLLAALLATADVSTVALLHPPGETSLPLAVFTIMANAPESLVASLCLAYVGSAIAILLAAMLAMRRTTS